MKLALILSFFTLLVSCVPSASVKKESSSGSINASAPYLWSDKNFPKTAQISSDFTAAEVTAITDMGTAWKTAVADQYTFFGWGARTAEISNTLSTMDQLYDGVSGVYKTTNWPTALPGSALAVTQLFGRRYNTGSSSEFVNIEHADILLNNDNFNFDTASGGPNYDMRTVILHEMGHYLGLQHNTTVTRANTVMYPSINSVEEKRVPQNADINILASNYGINLGGGGSGIAVDIPVYDAENGHAGDEIKILIELHSTGECIHKIDDAVVGRHHVKLKN